MFLSCFLSLAVSVCDIFIVFSTQIRVPIYLQCAFGMSRRCTHDFDEFIDFDINASSIPMRFLCRRVRVPFVQFSYALS